MSRLLSVSIPDEMAEEIEQVAREQGVTKSDVVRGALRRQLAIDGLRESREYGRRQAERLGIGPEDIEDLVDEVRAEMLAERP